jgi:protein TonB
MPIESAARRELFSNCVRPDGPGPVVMMPDWIERPSADAVKAAYPPVASAAKISGRAVVQCVVGVDGANHECRVVEETPRGRGFGEAALGLSKLYVMTPMKRDCVPVDGGIVRLGFNFSP